MSFHYDRLAPRAMTYNSASVSATVSEVPIGCPGFKGQIVGFDFTTSQADPVDGTDYWLFVLKKNAQIIAEFNNKNAAVTFTDSNSGTQTVPSVAVVATDINSGTLSTYIPDLQFDENDYFTLTITKAASATSLTLTSVNARYIFGYESATTPS